MRYQTTNNSLFFYAKKDDLMKCCIGCGIECPAVYQLCPGCSHRTPIHYQCLNSYLKEEPECHLCQKTTSLKKPHHPFLEICRLLYGLWRRYYGYLGMTVSVGGLSLIMVASVANYGEWGFDFSQTKWKQVLFSVAVYMAIIPFNLMVYFTGVQRIAAVSLLYNKKIESYTTAIVDEDRRLVSITPWWNLVYDYIFIDWDFSRIPSLMGHGGETLLDHHGVEVELIPFCSDLVFNLLPVVGQIFLLYIGSYQYHFGLRDWKVPWPDIAFYLSHVPVIATWILFIGKLIPHWLIGSLCTLVRFLYRHFCSFLDFWQIKNDGSENNDTKVELGQVISF